MTLPGGGASDNNNSKEQYCKILLPKTDAIVQLAVPKPISNANGFIAHEIINRMQMQINTELLNRLHLPGITGRKV